jgi:PPOX class probable F420-dependent enzyme
MPSRRREIQMTDREAWEFIESCKSVQIATLNQDGSPHLTTLWFAVVDGEIVFETFTKSQKVLNLQRDPRIALLFEQGLQYEELRGVSINGRARLVSEPEQVYRLALALSRRNNPGVPADALDQLARQLARKRTAVCTRPERIVSWDHRKLGVPY